MPFRPTSSARGTASSARPSKQGRTEVEGAEHKLRLRICSKVQSAAPNHDIPDTLWCTCNRREFSEGLGRPGGSWPGGRQASQDSSLLDFKRAARESAWPAARSPATWSPRPKYISSGLLPGSERHYRAQPGWTQRLGPGLLVEQHQSLRPAGDGQCGSWERLIPRYRHFRSALGRQRHHPRREHRPRQRAHREQRGVFEWRRLHRGHRYQRRSGRE
jgi:hypothetical protein